MQPQTARWTAPDVATKGPARVFVQIPWTLNPYGYARQAPTVYWDPSGDFATEMNPLAQIEIQLGLFTGRGSNLATHEAITRSALGSTFSGKAANEIANADARSDIGTQGTSPEDTAVHRMRGEVGGVYETPLDAAAKSDNLINQRINQSVDALLKGDVHEARADFGQALHTIPVEKRRRIHRTVNPLLGEALLAIIHWRLMLR